MKKFTKGNILFIGILLLTGLSGMTSVILAQDGPWTFKTPIPTGRGFTTGTVIDGKIYVTGGFPTHHSVTTANEMYDPEADTWTEMDSMPAGRCAHATCTFDGKMYVFGGLSVSPYGYANNNVWEYDPQADTWTQKADMPYENAFCGIAVLNDTIYLIGGTTNFYEPPITTVMAYEPVTETWTEKAPLSSARAFMSACVFDGKIYIFGGGDENLLTISYKYVEAYDPATNTWTSKTDMPTGRFGVGTCAMDDKVYAVGGVSNGIVVVTKNEMYDPATDTWTTKSSLQELRHTYFFGSVGDKIYAIGGSYPDPGNTSEPVILTTTSVEEYDPAADTTIATSIERYQGTALASTGLYNAYPNPFNQLVTIKYELPVRSRVVINIINLLGQEVITLVDENMPAGLHEVMWDGKNSDGQQMEAGIYFATLTFNNKFSGTTKLLLQK
jgi:N-acetylneuraminic acid mutarotase